jgi:hypothetical protein
VFKLLRCVLVKVLDAGIVALHVWPVWALGVKAVSKGGLCIFMNNRV